MKISYFMALGALCFLFNSTTVSAEAACSHGDTIDLVNFTCARPKLSNGQCPATYYGTSSSKRDTSKCYRCDNFHSHDRKSNTCKSRLP